MIKRILAALTAFVVLLALVFVGYGWWTRRGGPTFSEGGAFGAQRSVVPAAILEGGSLDQGSAPAAAGEQAAQTRETAAARTTASSGTRTTRAAAATTVAVDDPAAGTYRYNGTGDERVRFGTASPCGWDIRAVTVTVKPQGDDHVFDWTYSENRQQRLIKRFSPGAITVSYLGAAVTCLGVRETTEDSYDPDPVWLDLPLKVGKTWHSETRSENRKEVVDGRILGTETITVPAGTFKTYKVHSTVQLSDGQTGSAEMTHWFSPALGMNVKEKSHTEAKDGDASFTSDYTLELADTP